MQQFLLGIRGATEVVSTRIPVGARQEGPSLVAVGSALIACWCKCETRALLSASQLGHVYGW